MDTGEKRGGDGAAGPEDVTPSGQRRGWWLGCAGLLGLLLMIPAWELFRGIRPPSSAHEQIRKKMAEAEAAGLAVSLSRFQAKYPVTSRGAAAVEEAARSTELLKYAWSTTSGVSLPEETPASFTAFDLMGLVEANTGAGRGSITTASLRALVRDNEVPLEQLMALARTVPLDELGWVHSFDDLSPLEDLNVREKIAGRPGTFLILRESSRVVLPAAVYCALADGETSRAYAMVLAWGHLSRAQKVGGTTLVSAMIGTAVDSIHLNVIAELIKVSPPDRETAEKLHNSLDPELLRRDWLRGCEAEVIRTHEVLYYLAGDRPTLPAGIAANWGDVRQDWKARARKEFSTGWGSFLSGLTSSSPRWNPPQFARLKRAWPELLRGEIYEAISAQTEWPVWLKGCVEAPTIGEAEKRASDAYTWAERATMRNVVVAETLPAFGRATMNMRGVLAKAAVLRGTLLVRMAELEISATQAPLPASLHEICKQLRKPLPLDPLSDVPGTPVEYEPHPESGTWTIRHRPNRKSHIGETPFEFHGRWEPPGRKNAGEAL